MAANNFSHIELPLLQEDRAKLRGGGKLSEETKNNKKRRAEHSEFLRSKADHLNQYWQRIRQERQSAGAPELPEEVPILLNVDPGLDVEALTKFFDFEIVSEQEDGFILVASPDLNFEKFLSTVSKFESSSSGGATAAAIHNLSDSEDQTPRLQRILSEDLFASWGDISDTASYTIDVGVECVGKTKIPVFPVKRPKERTNTFQRRLDNFKEAADKAYQEWDNIKAEREIVLDNFVKSYSGSIISMIDDSDATYQLPDSFTARVSLNGKGLRDLALNFPYVFEVSSPDEVNVGKQIITAEEGQLTITLESPEENSPNICVIDSGLQEAHPLLKEAIASADSHCYLPGSNTTDVSDYVMFGQMVTVLEWPERFFFTMEYQERVLTNIGSGFKMRAY